MVPNSMIRDPRLKLKDVGLLCYMLSLPQDWEFSVRGMDAVLAQDGRTSVSESIRRLTACGYLSIQPNRTKLGVIQRPDWIVRDAPCHGFPDTGDPDTDKPTQTKNITNKENRKQEAVITSPGGEEAEESGQKSEPIIQKEEEKMEYYIGEDGLVNWIRRTKD